MPQACNVVKQDWLDLRVMASIEATPHPVFPEADLLRQSH